MGWCRETDGWTLLVVMYFNTLSQGLQWMSSLFIEKHSHSYYIQSSLHLQVSQEHSSWPEQAVMWTWLYAIWLRATRCHIWSCMCGSCIEWCSSWMVEHLQLLDSTHRLHCPCVLTLQTPTFISITVHQITLASKETPPHSLTSNFVRTSSLLKAAQRLLKTQTSV